MSLRILLQTRFPPSVGGIETLALVLCREWMRVGCNVTVVTDVPVSRGTKPDLPYRVFHQPSPMTLLSLWRSHDVVVAMNVSLKAAWPMLLARTPVVFTHHSPYWLDRQETRDWREFLKLQIARRSDENICVSEFIKRATGLKHSKVVHNCYDDTIFSNPGIKVRDYDVAFVGRLVSDKGADLLLHAVSRLPTSRGLTFSIIGDGPERSVLEALVCDFRLKDVVRFTGPLSPHEVAWELQRHKIMVVPSLWKEPFGIVALEGMACGCAVLVANGGGLPQAIGRAGRAFERGSVESLVENMSDLLNSPLLREELAKLAIPHLKRHGSKQMAGAYLEVIRRAVP